MSSKVPTIAQMVHRNHCTEVAQCLCRIWLVYEVRAKFSKLLKILRQAFIVYENAEDNNNEDVIFALVLHRTGLLHWSIGLTDKSLKVFEKLKVVI